MKTRPGTAITTPLAGTLTRRTLFKTAGAAALGGIAGCTTRTTPAPASRIAVPTYQSLGVRPVINCWGTMTVMGGSLELPEVKAAMDEASQSFVFIEELAAGVGKRLGELSGAEWGCVTSGAAGAIFAATMACVAGSDRRMNAQVPDLTGMKSEAVMARAHVTSYHTSTCRMVGLKLNIVDTKEEMEAAVNEKTAVIYILGEHWDRGDIAYSDIIEIGRRKGVPTFVDAAAERPDVPNVYLSSGADLVCYSGGKCMRGPQCAGLLLGRRDLCEAAVVNLSPNGGFGRPMKVGKEEFMGVLTALDLWLNGRDHEAEWREWEGYLDHIAQAVSAVPSVTTAKIEPLMRSNWAPTLDISWDRSRVNIEPREVHRQLLEGEPRIAVSTSNPHEEWRREQAGQSAPDPRPITIMPFQVNPGEEAIVARRLVEVLTAAVT